ncbi:MAG: glycosyl hydrolase [Bacteroidales bacterium]
MKKTICNFIKQTTICSTMIVGSLLFTQCTDDEPNNENGNITSGTIEFDLVDLNATTETKRLADNLRLTKEKGVILGQQQAYIEDRDVSPRTFTTDCDIYNVTGKYPLITGEDFLVLTNDSWTATNWYGKQSAAQKEWVIECYKMGVFTTFSWHMREPYNGDSFYVSDMDKVDLTLSAKAFKSILEGCENHEYYKAKLDLIADFCLSLIDEESGELIPIIFRPFHEMTGSWFWWGIPYYATEAEFIQNWQFTVKYLRDTRGVHNIIYAYSPSNGVTTESQFLACYPGDDYVDILGIDSYTDYSSGTSAKETTITQLELISSLAKSRGKICALTECGYDIVGYPEITDMYNTCYLNFIEESGADIAYMLYWYNSDDKNFIPTETSSSAMISSFNSFVNNDKILMMDDIISPCSEDYE